MLVGDARPVALGVGRLVPAVAHIRPLGIVHVADLLVVVGLAEVSAACAICRVQALGARIGTHALLAGMCVAGRRLEAEGPGVRGAARG